MKITIYIPQPGSTLATQIERGSVVIPIGNPRSDGTHAICWEGRAFGERLPSTFADRAVKAYERSRNENNDKRKIVADADILPVGRLETTTGMIDVEFQAEAAAIAEWIGVAALDPFELATTRGVVAQMMRDSVRAHGDQL